MCSHRLLVLLALLAVAEVPAVEGGDEDDETCGANNIIADNMKHVISMSAGTMGQTIADAKHGVLLVYYYGA